METREVTLITNLIWDIADKVVRDLSVSDKPLALEYEPDREPRDMSRLYPLDTKHLSGKRAVGLPSEAEVAA